MVDGEFCILDLGHDFFFLSSAISEVIVLLLGRKPLRRAANPSLARLGGIDQLDFLLELRVRIGFLISTNQSKLASDRDRDRERTDLLPTFN